MERRGGRKPWKGRRRKPSGTGSARGAAEEWPGDTPAAGEQAEHAPAPRRGSRPAKRKTRRVGDRKYGRRGSRPRPGRTKPLNTTQIALGGDLLVPYGIPKWDIGMVRLSAVTPRGSYLTSSVPLVHIRPAERVGYRLGDHARANGLPSPAAALADLGAYCDPRSQVETHFLDAYRCFLENADGDASNALAPIPQAHLYLDDPLTTATASPEFMVKADFAFWTGTGFIVVEIDGGSHIGNPRHITKDRALRNSGVEVVHILNEEVDRCGAALIKWLMSVIHN